MLTLYAIKSRVIQHLLLYSLIKPRKLAQRVASLEACMLELQRVNAVRFTNAFTMHFYHRSEYNRYTNRKLSETDGWIRLQNHQAFIEFSRAYLSSVSRRIDRRIKDRGKACHGLPGKILVTLWYNPGHSLAKSLWQSVWWKPTDSLSGKILVTVWRKPCGSLSGENLLTVWWKSSDSLSCET